jgi:hypothetical protein
MRTKLLLLLFLCLSSLHLLAQPDWLRIQSVEEVYASYPDQIRSIFQNLNLDYPGLEKVKNAFEKNDIPLACKFLLEYYGKSTQVLKELPKISDLSTTAGDSLLQDIFTFQKVTGKVPRLENGHLDWNCMGPEKDIEWAWALNRHYPARDIMDIWFKTGNPKYAKQVDIFVKDWIICSWPYPAVKSITPMWRGLEVSFRVKTWAKVFYQMWNTHCISPATQLLILSSIPQHAHYARNFHAQGNWLTMEISGLATAASSWPEFKESPSWIDYSVRTMVESMKDQVYPDGVQTELTSSYHQVALSNFNLFAEICSKNSIPLPEYYTKTLEAMNNYLALTMRPDGYGLLNNDADLIYNAEYLQKAAKDYHRPDWLYIATNMKSGTKPLAGPSYVFPYAGQLISRSGFGQDAQWSFFDLGPWGSGHQHNDKLHLSVAAYGRDLLVDAGRFAYRGEVANKFRKYATGSFGHNLVLVDGKGQAAGPLKTTEPLNENLYAIQKDFDYGSGTFDNFNGVEGTFSHTRAMVYVRGKFWVVADRLKTDRPRKIEVLWHWHPTCLVEADKTGIVYTHNEKGNLRIIPVDSPSLEIRMVKGEESPAIQGWYSREYNIYEPNTTSIYTGQLKSDDTFAWILWPSEGSSPDIKAEILAKDDLSVKIRVSEPGKGSWEVLVPFADSKKVTVNKSSK